MYPYCPQWPAYPTAPPLFSQTWVCMCRPCDIYLQIPCYRFSFKCSFIFQVKLEYTQTHNFMCVHPFPICCQFSLVRKAPFSIFVLQVCWQRVLICVKAPLVFRCLWERDLKLTGFLCFPSLYRTWKMPCLVPLVSDSSAVAPAAPPRTVALSLCTARRLPVGVLREFAHNGPRYGCPTILKGQHAAWISRIFFRRIGEISLSIAHIFFLYTLCSDVSMTHTSPF